MIGDSKLASELGTTISGDSRVTETIKTYQGNSIGVSACLVALESFIGDVENAGLADDSTFDASDAVTAINALIWVMERRETEVERLRALILNIQSLAEKGYPFDTEKLATRCRESLAHITSAGDRTK